MYLTKGQVLAKNIAKQVPDVAWQDAEQWQQILKFEEQVLEYNLQAMCFALQVMW